MDVIHLLPEVIASVIPMLDIPDVQPDMNGPFTGAMMRIVNIIAGAATIACVLAIIIAGAVLAFGNLDSRHKTTGWMVIIGAAVGAMVLGSASALMTFFFDIPLV